MPQNWSSSLIRCPKERKRRGTDPMPWYGHTGVQICGSAITWVQRCTGVLFNFLAYSRSRRNGMSSRRWRCVHSNLMPRIYFQICVTAKIVGKLFRRLSEGNRKSASVEEVWRTTRVDKNEAFLSIVIAALSESKNFRINLDKFWLVSESHYST